MALPKDPRQLMINLMYLVLTAMLALNITKEVLTAFMTINGSIEKSNNTIIGKNNQFYKSFDDAENTADRAKVKPYNDKAKEIKAKSEELYKFLDGWKDTMITRSGGWDMVNGVKEVKSPEDINTPTMLLVEQKKGDEIKKRMLEFADFVIQRVDKPEDKERIRKQIPIQIKDLPHTEDNPQGDWSYGTFHNIPVVASVAMFSKFQNDIKNAESMVLDYLASQVYLEDKKFDALVAIATPNTTYALEGQEIETQIVLAAYNKSANPGMSSSAGAVQVKDGVGTLKIKASGAGPKTVNGVITIETNGKKEAYNYNFKYTVGSAGASLQLDKMNVMYIGVENPVTLSASGYNIEDVKLNMPWATLKPGPSKGTYLISVDKSGTFDYSIDASSRGGATGGKINTGKIRVKSIPNPNASVGNKQGGLIATNVAKAQVGVSARLDDFVFETQFKVTHFRFTHVPKIGEPFYVEVTGNSFNAECDQIKQRSKPGDRWLFENIKAIGPDKRERPINSIVLTLN